jgi:hypothetical protein
MLYQRLEASSAASNSDDKDIKKCGIMSIFMPGKIFKNGFSGHLKREKKNNSQRLSIFFVWKSAI